MHVGRILLCVEPGIALMVATIIQLRWITSLIDGIITTTRCRNLKQACNCMFHEISLRMAPAFNTDEQFTSSHPRRLLSSHREELRKTANPEIAMASRWNRTGDGSSSDDVWRLGSRKRQRQRYFLLRRAPLCVSGAVRSRHTAVATFSQS